RQDETCRTVDLGHSSDGPSWIDLAENRVNTTESRFAVRLNRLLQQNRHFSEVKSRASGVLDRGKADFMRRRAQVQKPN
ncbi:MAG: hypothetical protein Q8M18_13865, partial [Bradyrhizobium sp.]|nr:hypothetical protein [Bradyrhizobium sp.]